MTVRQTETIDWLGIERDSGHILLTAIDDLDWMDAPMHLAVLQEKLNTYLRFVESGEVFEQLAEKLGNTLPRATPVKVRILAKYAPTQQARAFLQYARAAFAKGGLELTHDVIPEAS